MNNLFPKSPVSQTRRNHTSEINAYFLKNNEQNNQQKNNLQKTLKNNNKSGLI